MIVVSEGSEHGLKQVVFFDLWHLFDCTRLRILSCKNIGLFVSDVHFWPDFLLVRLRLSVVVAVRHCFALKVRLWQI